MEITSLKLLQYRKAENLTDVAEILGLKPAHLSYALYKLDKNGFPKKYEEFKIAKKLGGDRTIKAPHPTLKIVQSRLAQDLLAIERELEKQRVKNTDGILAHGFKKELSIITNATNHLKQRYVFNIDLKDFFPTINFGRIRGYFIKNRDFELKPAVATVLAQIASHDNQLPQGSPCSPVISNLVAHILDIRLNELAKKHHCSYSRYVDDITFSTSEKEFPSAIGSQVNGSTNLWDAGSKLLKIIQQAGFNINPTKTRMQLRYSRQDVTGIVVNQKVNIPVDYYETVSAMCHHLFMDGECFTKVGGVKQRFSTSKLRGRLAYIYQVRGKGPKIQKTISDEQPKSDKYFWESTKLFQRFLDYSDLFRADRPIVLCEGVTDTIYIKAAIRALAAKYPSLISSAGVLTLKLFKYTKTSASIQELSGGVGGLGNLLNKHADRTKKYKRNAKYPLILVVDSDQASKNAFKKTGAKDWEIGLKPWYHFRENVYLVSMPLVGEIDTPIERLFEPHLLDTIYQGKKFDKANAETDGSKYYGKKIFATKVVAANKGTINFDGFEPLLTAIAAVIDDYKTRIIAP